jgi:hypothetical protein
MDRAARGPRSSCRVGGIQSRATRPSLRPWTLHSILPRTRLCRHFVAVTSGIAAVNQISPGPPVVQMPEMDGILTTKINP